MQNQIKKFAHISLPVKCSSWISKDPIRIFYRGRFCLLSKCVLTQLIRNIFKNESLDKTLLYPLFKDIFILANSYAT